MRHLLVLAPLAAAAVAWLFAGVAPPEPPEPPGPDLLARRLEFAVSDPTGFRRLGPAKPGEWLDRFDEPGQSFDRYVAGDPVRADGARKTLAFVLVGPFSDGERRIAKAAVRVAGIWFDLETRTLPGHDLPAAGWQRARVSPWTGEPTVQYHAHWFLRRLLPGLVPPDAVVLNAITMGDLYPEDSWNFVFGMATFERRVAVSSFARYYARFRGEPETAATRRRALLRAAAVLVHEAGHAFGLRHCIEYECGMNGSNSLRESDSRPMFLCPGCLRKLQWNRGFDVVRRYRRLEAIFREQGLDDQARWLSARADLIESVE